MTNTDLEELLVNQPPEVQAEIIRINTEARPIALQVALLIPIVASLLGPGDVVPHGPAAGSRVIRRGRRARPGLRRTKPAQAVGLRRLRVSCDDLRRPPAGPR